MNDFERHLPRLREAWEASKPSSTEVQRGVENVARRLRLKRGRSDRKAWGFFGAFAVLLAAMAYAGLGGPRQDPSAFPVPPPGAALDMRSGERTPRPQVSEITPVPSGPAEPTAAFVPSAPLVAALRVAPVDDVGSRENALPTPRPSAPPLPTARRAASDPSWVEVSNALAASDPDRAEVLLGELASQGHDPNTRAKAKLGIAQLDAAKGNCTRAKALALQVASSPKVETKTVRRALELAARCTQ